MTHLRLIADARKVWHRLWSVRFSLLSAVFAAGQTCLDYYTEGQPHIIVIGAFLLSLGSAAARLVDQPALHGIRKEN